MNAYVIKLVGSEIADRATRRLFDSAPGNLEMKTFDAITPDTVDAAMKKRRVKWNYPWEGQEYCFKSGLIKRAYQTRNPKARMACFMSHYILWEKVVKYDSPQIIFEHDAVFFPNIEHLPIEDFNKSKYDIIGLNSPMSATRMSKRYDELVQGSKSALCDAPYIDEYNIPQGIAGNSSYYINPNGAAHMISLTKEYGAWPNDALMCKQLVNKLGQTKKYYTHVQGLPSTTT